MEMEVEDEVMEIEGPSSSSMLTRFFDVPYAIWVVATTLLVNYGWYLFGLAVLYGVFRHKIEEAYIKWRRRRDEFEYAAKYHKDSDLARSRMEAVIAAREKLQHEHELKAAEAERKRLEREEKKKAERAAAAQEGAGGYRLGTNEASSSDASTSAKSLRADYFPLMGSPGSGGYKAPKKSCCKKGGGCG